MDKNQALSRLSEIERETAELRKIIEAPEVKGLWKPEHGGGYYKVASEGETSACTHSSHPFDDMRFQFGNCYPSREIAKKAAERMAFCNKVIAACLQADPEAGPWIKGERMWCATWYVSRGSWAPESFDVYAGDIMYVHSREQAEEACRILTASGIKP